MKTLIVVPAHNEKEKIKEVISDLKSHGFNDILVVDDGSTDQTGLIADAAGAVVIRHIINRGLGAALGTGFEYARRLDYDCLVTFDGDGQHQAKYLQNLISPIRNNQCDVVVGSRFLKKDSSLPAGRFLVNYVSNIATWLLYGVWTSDTLSGLRAFNREAISKINLKTDKMEVSNEFFWEIKRNNLKFAEVPIECLYTDYSQKHSHNFVSLSHTISIGKGMLLRLFR